MRAIKFGVCLFVCIGLIGCVSSLIVGNQLQYRLMGALIKPLVGFDPNDVNLFEIPVVKERMTDLLGEHYQPTMELLRTAQEIQQEGALYYVVSRYAPEEVSQYTDQAAMIWNADTNQLAVLLIEDGLPQLFSEQIEGIKTAIIPTLPSELVDGYEQAVAFKDNMGDAQQRLRKSPQAAERALRQTEQHRTCEESVDEIRTLEKTQNSIPRCLDTHRNR